MALDSNIETIIKNNITYPAFVLSKDLNIVGMNDAGEEFLNAKVHDSFLQFFDEYTSQYFERMFLEAGNQENPVKEKVKIKTINFPHTQEFLVIISIFRIDKNEYFLVSLDAGFQRKKISAAFEVITEDFDSLIQEREMREIFSDIKKNYPFSIIEKKQIQKKIDRIGKHVWFKDKDGKYIFVNKIFAESIGMKTTQIEGRAENEALSGYLSRFFELVNNYIFNTANAVILKGVDKTTPKIFDLAHQIIEIPILDIDNNVIAIFGCAYDAGAESYSEEEKNETSLFESAVLSSDIATVIFDREFNIQAINHSAKNLFSYRKKNDEDFDLPSEVFGKELWTKIQFQAKKENGSGEVIKFFHQIKGNKDYPVKIEISLTDLTSVSGEQIGYLLNAIERKQNAAAVNVPTADSAKQLISNFPEAVLVYETESLKFLFANKAAVELYGYSKESFLQMDLTDLYAPEDIQSLLEANSGAESASVLRHKKSDGSSVLVETQNLDFEFEGKKAQLTIVKNVDEKIAQSKQLQLFKTAFETSDNLIFITDTEGFIRFANAKVNELLGFFDAELEERPFLSLLADGDRARVNTNIFHAKITSSEAFDISVKNSENEYIDMHLIAAPIFSLNNQVESYSIILKLKRDPKGETIVTKTVRESGDSSGINPTFLSNLFHELLTPINVIVGFVQELTDSVENPNEEQLESLDIIKENQKLLLQTMNTAVEYSHIEQKDIKLKPEKTVFVDLLDELEDNTKKFSSSKGVELSYSKISSSLSFVSDKQRFTSLLTLFVKFAIQMTKEKKIFLSAYHYGDDSFILAVKDSREGITPNLLKNLRELYTADETVIRHAFGSSRFTVRLLKKLTEILAEKREVVTKENEPFEFGLVFPTTLAVDDQAVKPEKTKGAAAKAGEKPVEETEELKEDEKPEEPLNIDYSQLSCLYVEDQIDSQILFKVQMKDLKAIEFADSFENALPLLKSKSFNFIVLDINLQGAYNGLDALRVIRKMPVYIDVPIIAVSAYVLPGDKERFIEAGFDDFIAKPVLRDKLYASLNSILKKYAVS
ncbi:MAG: PAS domain S-box protein [Chlorobi bacterium]|nr:PAS domain S-box protein [Chlorobiota bacterium]